MKPRTSNGIEPATGNSRKFLRVTDFDRLQSPKRPKRPTWVKSYTRDLDQPDYLDLSLFIRGFLCDFIKLAASMRNRVPNDARFIARKLGIRPQDVGKAVAKLISLRYVTEFAEDLETRKINDMEHLTDAAGLPRQTASLSESNSQSQSPDTNYQSVPILSAESASSPVCPHCDGEGCAWCRLNA